MPKFAQRAQVMGVVLFFAATLLSVSCQGPPKETAEVSASYQPIVNGVKEDEYPGVGALTLVMGEEYTGSFCTGTLIDPSWVLTAAHCVVGGFGRMQGREGAPDDTFFHFFIGSRADRRESGALHQAAAVHIHPGYTARGGQTFYDIALMELAEPIADVPIYPIFEGDLAELEGEEVFYTGFGMTDGVERTGGGVKHSKNLVIHRVYAATYSTRQNDGGVCFGDSGGPGLLQTEDGYRTVGVNSAAIGEVPCMGWSSQMRADAYHSWIRSVMGQQEACADDPDLCQCPEACGADGVCDNSQCGPLRCDGVFDCQRRCQDAACQYGCFASLVPMERFLIEQVWACVEASCPDRTQMCVDQNCGRELFSCFEGLDAARGEATCADIHWCADRCDSAGCVNDCYFAGSFDAQEQYRPVEDCIDANCPDGPFAMGRSACIARHCRREMLTCLPPDSCSLTGGACEEGEACVPAAWGATYCLATDGLPPGAACVIGGVSCEEGSLCLGGAEGAFCRSLCATDADCPNGMGPCERRAAPGAPFPVGLCSQECRDADRDGVCDEDDCGPEDAMISPAADEICGDDVDQDCDDEIDEGCVVCVDLDEDTFCEEEDCDDDDPDVSPDASEICADGVDNDCDEMVDEGCPATRVDAGAPDAAAPARDMALEPVDAGAIELRQGDGDPTESGCACSSHHNGGGDWFLLLPCVLLGLRRRRLSGVGGVATMIAAGGLCVLLSGCGSEAEPAAEAPSMDALQDQDVSDAQVITMQTDGTVEADASAPDLGFDSAVVDAGRALDSEMADAEPLNDAAPIDAAPADPSIQRIQRGLEVAGSQVDLFDVIIGSPFGRDGVFISDGRSDAYSGLWVSFDESVNLPDWPMGASISVTGVVTERSYEGEMDEVVTGTRTQLNVGSLDAIERTVDRDLPAPVSVGLGELAIPEIAELFEGVLVSVSGVEVTRTLRGGGIILNGILTVDTHFIPEVHAWAVNGLEFEEVIGIVDFRAEGFVLVPRVDADMPRPPASLGDCFPIGGAYSLCTDGKHWRRAQDACAVNGARLVILETAEENQAVADMVSPWHDGSFWIGLSDRETEGEFIWHNGAPLEYSGWANNEPNDHGAGEDCAESSWGGTGVWNDARCNQGRVYVCEYAEAAPPCMGEGICPDGARCGEGVCQRPMAGD